MLTEAETLKSLQHNWYISLAANTSSSTLFFLASISSTSSCSSLFFFCSLLNLISHSSSYSDNKQDDNNCHKIQLFMP